jgi:hypothetical protein
MSTTSDNGEEDAAKRWNRLMTRPLRPGPCRWREEELAEENNHPANPCHVSIGHPPLDFVPALIG